MRVCINAYEDALKVLKGIQEENNIEADIKSFLVEWVASYLGLCYKESSLEYIKETYKKYEMLDDWDKKKLAYLIDVLSYDFESAFDRLEDVVCYEAKDWEDLAIKFIEEGLYGEDVSRLWETNSCYLDTEYMARELYYEYDEYDGYFFRLC